MARCQECSASFSNLVPSIRSVRRNTDFSLSISRINSSCLASRSSPVARSPNFAGGFTGVVPEMASLTSAHSTKRNATDCFDISGQDRASSDGVIRITRLVSTSNPASA